MRITRLTAIVACIIAFVQVAFAADPTIRLRFEIDTLRGYICLQARVNDNREPEWFIFDTGANFALGLHSKAASRLNISYDKTQWKAFSETSTFRGGYRVPEATLHFGEDITLRVKGGIFVLPEDEEFPFVVAVGKKLIRAAGIIGIGLFPKRYVKISYDTNEIVASPTPIELDGWQEVTAQYEDHLPFVQLKVGNQPMIALLDSGASNGLTISRSQFSKLVREEKPSDSSSFYFPTRSFPTTKLGEYPLSLELIDVIEKERPYFLFGALEMIYYNWIINTDGMRVYAKRRQPQPKVYAHTPFSVIFHTAPFYWEEKFFAIPTPLGALWQAGLRSKGDSPDDFCVILEINGVSVPSEIEGITPKQLSENLLRLIASPFTETARLRLLCEGREREFTFQLFPAYKLYEFGECLAFGGDFKYEYTEDEGKLHITFTFSDPRWSAFYRVNGQPVEQHNQEHPHKVVRVVGLPEEFGITDFIEYMHTQLCNGRSVTVICLDEAGQEVEVEIPPRERVKQEAVSADESAPNQQSRP
jgi:hypothetical protein